MGATGILYFTYIFPIFVLFIPSCIASNGDRSPFYLKCVSNCLYANCSDDGHMYQQHASKQLDIWSQLLWKCKDECGYHCMWKTVAAFEERNYNFPKFHGKWPFVRLFGIQEPASVFSSILNLASHVYMNYQLRNLAAKELNTRYMPIVYLWNLFTAICIHGWLWSTIFHTRDNSFTEFMDYTCALSMVMTFFIAAAIRLFYRKRKICTGVVIFTITYFFSHARYLYSGRIDYDYNMIVNLVFGVTGSLLWIIWAILQYMSGQRYVWRMLVFTVLSACSLSLELLDFPPIYGWDAHAIWHLSTAPQVLLFYRVIMDDLKYIQDNMLSYKERIN